MGKNNRGVSLIELLVTIGIVVALCGIVVPVISSVRNNGNKAEARAEMVQLDTALIAFFTDNGYYPKPGLQEMVASLRDGYFDFDPERLEGDIYKDPWGEPYTYASPGVVSSRGYDLDSVVLGRAMADTDSSGIPTGEEKDIQLGQASGQDKKVIWGFNDPVYNDLIKAMLSLIRNTDVGYELAAKINMANLPIYWAELTGDALARYWPYQGDDQGIYLNVNKLIDKNGNLTMPIEAIAAILAHEATHHADHLASGDMDFDSIEEEYDAFYNGAMVWEQIKGDKTDATLDEVLSVMKQDEKAAKDWVRKKYPDLPEEDQWGDSYVVPKES